jgi:hypothetical protein
MSYHQVCLRRVFCRVVLLRTSVVATCVCLFALQAVPGLRATAADSDSGDVAYVSSQRMLVCGMDEVFEIDLADVQPDEVTKRWSWRAKDCSELPATLQNQFRTTDECKPIDADRYLVTSSGGGCAMIERSSGNAIWYASVPNAHSIELLPNNRVVVASSTNANGNRLVLFDLDIPETPIWHTPLYSAHGVVWDESRQRLFALGFDVLQCYELSDWDSRQPSLKLHSTHELPDEGGHDLQPVPMSDDLVLSTHEHVYLFDRMSEAFRPHPDLHDKTDVKGVSIDVHSDRVVWTQGNENAWWTDTLNLLNPIASIRLEEEKIYKARWLPAASTDPERLSCEQASPQAMAEAAGVTLPPSPWHVANVWWNFEKPIEHFESLEMDVSIDRDVPDDYNLYVSPCGVAKINGLQFYGGLQTNVNGWADGENRKRLHPGKGGIFSRWSSDLKTPIGLEHVRTAAPECLVESAGYEGEFASVRRPFPWTCGTYTFGIYKGETDTVKSTEGTWFECRITSKFGQKTVVGSIFFEGTDFTFWERHSAFVEVYSTSKIPRSGIPKVNVTFGWPRINGEKIALKDATAYYPDQQGPSSPDCAIVKADGENCVVEVAEIFKREESKRRHSLLLQQSAPTN